MNQPTVCSNDFIGCHAGKTLGGGSKHTPSPDQRALFCFHSAHRDVVTSLYWRQKRRVFHYGCHQTWGGVALFHGRMPEPPEQRRAAPGPFHYVTVGCYPCCPAAGRNSGARTDRTPTLDSHHTHTDQTANMGWRGKCRLQYTGGHCPKADHTHLSVCLSTVCRVSHCHHTVPLFEQHFWTTLSFTRGS